MRRARWAFRPSHLWRLGSEDRALWKIWDSPRDADAVEKLKVVDPGQDVDIEGDGDILRIESKPSPGTRDLTVDANGLITDEVFQRTAQSLPRRRLWSAWQAGCDQFR